MIDLSAQKPVEVSSSATGNQLSSAFCVLLVALLLIVIAANELQRTMAMSAAHRQRVGAGNSIAELDRKVDWLLLIAPPTPSVLQLRPPLAAGSQARRP